MLRELVCQDLSKKQKHYLSLSRQRYEIGKALSNDIVILDCDASASIVHLEKCNGQYNWVDGEKRWSAESNPFVSGHHQFYVKNRRREFVVGLLLLLAWLCGSGFYFFHSNKLSISGAPVQLPARGTYGNLNPDHRVDSVAFEFRPQKDRYSVLHYTPGNIDAAEDLEISVNGRAIGFAPTSVRRWNVEQSVVLSAQTLRDSNNRLEFIFRGSQKSAWAVREIYVDAKVEQPVLQNVNDLLKNAEKLFRERNVRSGNLIRAQQFAQQAGLFYYSRQQAYPQILHRILSKIQSEKNKMIGESEMLMQKFQRQGDLKKARNIYRSLMNELIDPMDADRSRILRSYENLQ